MKMSRNCAKKTKREIIDIGTMGYFVVTFTSAPCTRSLKNWNAREKISFLHLSTICVVQRSLRSVSAQIFDSEKIRF